MSDPPLSNPAAVFPDRRLRIAVLWQRMTGYLDACLRALSATEKVRLVVAFREPSEDAPYDERTFSRVGERYRWKDQPEPQRLKDLIGREALDAVLVCSWNVPAYRALLPELGRRGVARILCMDNQWNGTPKQWLGRVTWRQFLRPYYDLVFVPGYRQAQFARRLGFRREHIIRGLYCADTPAFTMPATWGGKRERSFIYVGRLLQAKGIATLAQAYRAYRQSVDNPWPLLIAGNGPDTQLLDDLPGVRMLGFLQPDRLPLAMWGSTALICPSIFEPWGVVVHEATAAGLLVVCSEAVGAGVHLVQDGYNGFVVPTGVATDLARAMSALTNSSDDRLCAMSEGSVRLSEQLSPGRWADYLLEMIYWQQ